MKRQRVRAEEEEEGEMGKKAFMQMIPGADVYRHKREVCAIAYGESSFVIRAQGFMAVVVDDQGRV